jgi:hypothetical protein
MFIIVFSTLGDFNDAKPPQLSVERLVSSTARLKAPPAQFETRNACGEELRRLPGTIEWTDAVKVQPAARPVVVTASWFSTVWRMTAEAASTLARFGHYNVMQQYQRLDRKAESSEERE